MLNGFKQAEADLRIGTVGTGLGAGALGGGMFCIIICAT